MKFDETRIYTSLTADVVKPGSRGYVADNLTELKEKVASNKRTVVVSNIDDESSTNRFRLASGLDYNLFYLVAEPTEKTFRPYKNTGEMVEDFMRKCYNSVKALGSLFMPTIWLKCKCTGEIHYVIGINNDEVYIPNSHSMQSLFDNYTYLDGSPVGMEE